MKFKIFAGLGGGFGGAEFQYIKEFASLEDAEEAAYSAALDIYDSYKGMHDLRTVSEIIEEDLQGKEYADLLEEELLAVAEEIYSEERESWLDYYVEEVTDDTQEDEDD